VNKTERTGQNPTRDIQILSDIKGSFGGDFAEQKAEVLNRVTNSKIGKAASLLDYHEALCYLRAYPDSSKILELVESELEGFFQRVESLPKSERARLSETGIVGSELSHPYGYFMTKWLLKEYPGCMDLDWDSYEQLEQDHILDLMPVLLTYCENDAVDDPRVPVADILTANINGRGINRLEWFMKFFERLSSDEPLKRLIFDKLELPMTINIANHRFARTHAKVPVRDLYYQKEPLQKDYPDLRKTARKSDLKPKLLARDEAKVVIDLHKTAMLMRHRELWPLTFSNLDEVHATSIGRGMTIYTMGMQPAWRLPLESNYAVLLMRNGVPIGYGIGAMVFDRIEFAINIFETFRRCEAGFIFGKFAQLFHQMFGCSYLLIRRYQVGYDNPEGLDSGAYWFYHKLGFRSIDPDIRKLAEGEVARIAAEKGYRSSKATLTQLAESDLCLDLKRPGEYVERDISLGQISLAQTRLIATLFDGDRDRADREAPALARKTLVVRSTEGWPPTERLWFNRLALLALSLPNLEEWTTRDKQNLVDIMKAKGALREQQFVRLLREHRKLSLAIAEMLSA
jgi:hypothetical protein